MVDLHSQYSGSRLAFDPITVINSTNWDGNQGIPFVPEGAQLPAKEWQRSGGH